MSLHRISHIARAVAVAVSTDGVVLEALSLSLRIACIVCLHSSVSSVSLRHFSPQTGFAFATVPVSGVHVQCFVLICCQLIVPSDVKRGKCEKE